MTAMVLSLRTRLIILHTAIVAVVLVAAGAGIYSYLSYSMLQVIDTSLDRSARLLERRVTHPDEPPPSGSLPIFVPQFVQMIAPDGNITDQMRDRDGNSLPVHAESLRRVDMEGTRMETVPDDSGNPVRAVTHRVLDDQGKTDFYIRVGQSLEGLRAVQHRVLVLLGVIVPGSLLLTMGGGWFLAGRAMVPVDRLTRAARSITEAKLSERVEVPHTSDEIQRLAETFNDMLDRLESAFSRQRQFTADASHELRTPLAIVRNEIEVALRRERGVADYQETLARLEAEIIRLSRLVEDLLTLARADAGEAKLDLEPLPIVLVAQEVFDNVISLAEKKGLKASFIAPDPSLFVRGDAMRLKQLFLNLLDNAIKYTDAPGAVTLSVGRDSGNVRMEVSDTGRGITVSSRPHVFERFYRQSHTTETASGSGLGLAIVHWIVSAHGGRIDLDSRPSEGTRFTVFLPLTEVPDIFDSSEGSEKPIS